MLAPKSNGESTEQITIFGRFTLFRARRQLLADGELVPLGSRALDLLFALLARAGEVVGKEELISAVWPGISVEETNLRVNIAALRKALGDGQAGARFIANVPGRGYSFVADIGLVQDRWPQAQRSETIKSDHRQSLPAHLNNVIGREEITADAVALLDRHRLVTLAGPGGIGKTTLALSVAIKTEGSFGDGACFVDLATIRDASMVASTLALSLRLTQNAGDTVDQLIEFLKGKRILIILDNCEHVVEAAASLAEALLKHTLDVRVLATSREALRAEGEWVLRVQPLDLPPRSPGLSAAEALRSSAVQLFVERASSGLGGYEFSDADAAAVSDICRKLDGIALAIELAAGHMGTFGSAEIEALLEDRFSLLRQGRRTAMPRHRTLRATLDWSYDLLPLTERSLLARLSVFNGTFTLDATLAICSGGEIPANDVASGLAGLVAKSMVVAELGEPSTRYRLLDTTRAYAQEKLCETKDVSDLCRKHAAFYQSFIEGFESSEKRLNSSAWMAVYGEQINNVRIALDWAFGPGGDCQAGVALTVAAIPLWSELSLVDECVGWVARSLEALTDLSGEHNWYRMRLHAARAGFEMYSARLLDSAVEGWTTVLALAEQQNDTDFQLRSLRALWANAINRGEFNHAFGPAERFRALATNFGDGSEEAIADRMSGANLHFIGELDEARQTIERALARYSPPAPRSHTVRFQFDQRVAARITLQRVLWLQGYADQALASVATNIAEVTSLDHTLSACNALTQAACPIALLTGDFERAENYIVMLEERTAGNSLDVWRTYAQAFRGELLLRSGKIDEGMGLIEPAVIELREAGFGHNLTSFLMTAADGQARSGHISAAQARIDEALAICVRTGERWCLAELQRVRGTLMLMDGSNAAMKCATAAFVQSLKTARSQGALSWELRTSTSYAKLLGSIGKRLQGYLLLERVTNRMTEGFGSLDHSEAKATLETLRSTG